MSYYQQGMQLMQQNRFAEAYAAFSQGAAEGDAACRVKMALCLLNGQGVAKNVIGAVDMFRALVAQDNAEARLHLGNLYAGGIGVEKDEKQALSLFEESAYQGFVPAMVRLGILYMEGSSYLPANPSAATSWIEKAIGLGSGEACNVLGVWCIAGRGVQRNPQRARELFERAHEAGVPDGTFNLAMTYFDGSCGDRDYVKSTQLLLEVANKGYVRAYQVLGMRYLKGIGVPPNPTEAKNWLYKSACVGDPEGENLYGTLLLQGIGIAKDVASARLWFEKSAAKGHAGACNNLGVCYLDGLGGEKDEAKAVELFERARQKQNPDGYFNLGLCQLGGRGTAVDQAAAYLNFNEAARRGHRSAPAHVGQCLVRGLGVAKDPDKGCNLLREAAMGGERTAMYFYAMCLLEGLGCFADEKEGVRYLQKAAELGYLPAQKELEKRSAPQEEARPVIATPDNPDEAVAQWKVQADSGDVAAMYRLGDAYERGVGTDQDYVLACVWYERSASKGNLKAQCALANLLWQGLGTTPNRTRAIKLWQQCALLGMRDAAYHLALAYREGEEGKPDPEQFFHWALVAADKGDSRAYPLVAQAYETGFGTRVDPVEAKKWKDKI